MKKVKKKTPEEITIPAGEAPEEYLDTEDPFEEETPDTIEEVTLHYE